MNIDYKMFRGLIYRFREYYGEYILGFDSCHKNTMDNYTGEWVSCPLFCNDMINAELLYNDKTRNNAVDILDAIDAANLGIEGYSVVGVEHNYMNKCKVEEHCDTVNFDNKRVRVIMVLFGQIEGKEEETFNQLSYYEPDSDEERVVTLKRGDVIAMDCTEPHSFECNASFSYLIFDMLPDEMGAQERMKYAMNPTYYYLERRYGP